jgi:hypothetical protein
MFPEIEGEVLIAGAKIGEPIKSGIFSGYMINIPYQYCCIKFFSKNQR